MLVKMLYGKDAIKKEECLQTYYTIQILKNLSLMIIEVLTRY